MEKIFKNLISYLLVTVIVLGGIVLPKICFSYTKAVAASYNGTCGKNLIWSFNESTGELIISGSGEMYNWENLNNVPWYNCKINIKTLTLKDGVISIGNNAFSYCVFLESVSLPNSITNIGDNAFRWCNALTDLTIPNSVTNIGTSAFSACENLTNITISNSLTKIENFAFHECTNLGSLTIPDGVKIIGDYSFGECSNLAKISIPKSVTTICPMAFTLCEKLSDVYYNGTKSDWNAITIDINNEELTNATIHFATVENTTMPKESTTKPVVSTTKPIEHTTKPVETILTSIVEIRRPSTSTITYGDSIILHADIEGKLPENAKIEWAADNGNFTIVEVSEDGITCKVTPNSSGDTVFTAKIIDEKGNEISKDSQKMTSKAGFFQKIIAFFKKLFGATKVIPQAFKGVF